MFHDEKIDKKTRASLELLVINFCLLIHPQCQDQRQMIAHTTFVEITQKHAAGLYALPFVWVVGQ